MLFRQGDRGPLYHLREGMLKIVRLHPDGGVVLLNLIIPGEVIPHHSLLSPNDYHGTAVALVESEVDVLPAADWYRQLEEEPVRYKQAAEVLQSRLRMMQQRMDSLTAPLPADRLRLFREWFSRYIRDTDVTDVLNQEEVGQWIGLRRETVNRLLRKG
ncbi:Crp/Fnr family transcriptional regulator [Paenibacillus sp. J31TS4]|nr:Crp/Fnr family transcriptional regulator [Paenibacillus sp. J31TS4]